VPEARVLNTQLGQMLRLMAFRLALLVAMATMLRVGWLLFLTEEWDTPSPVAIFLLCEIPLLVSLILGLGAGDTKRASTSAGIAFGAALIFSMLVPVLWVGAAFTPPFRSGPPYPHLTAFRLFLPYALLVSICVLVFACLVSKRSPAFFAGCGAGAGYCILAIYVCLQISIPGSGAAKTKLMQHPDPPSNIGAPALRSLVSCLIRHQTAHPQDGYPESLSKIDPSWACNMELIKPAGIQGYWLFYWPEKSAPNGRNTDFRMEAMSVDTFPYSVLVSDSRGMILEYKGGLVATGLGEPVGAWESFGSEIQQLRNAVRGFMATHPPGFPPQSIEDVMKPGDHPYFIFDPRDPNLLIVRHHASSDADADRDVWTIRYFPPTAEKPGEFAISSRCVGYGTDCIRSYYLDYYGDIHATGEPRDATSDDPDFADCELTPSSCGDPVWTIFARPSERLQTEANALYFLHTTKWW
jgi:hypothetical protein